MPATFACASVKLENAKAETGFGALWPTQPAVEPPVCDGMRTLNGTRRKPLMRPMIVYGRRNSMNSDDMF